MRYAVTVFARSLLPTRGGRLLVPEPRRVATLRAARVWLDMMRPTWGSAPALLPSEEGFTGAVLDEDGSEALALDYLRDSNADPIKHDREDLREMRAMRPKTKAKEQGTP